MLTKKEDGSVKQKYVNAITMLKDVIFEETHDNAMNVASGSSSSSGSGSGSTTGGSGDNNGNTGNDNGGGGAPPSGDDDNEVPGEG